MYPRVPLGPLDTHMRKPFLSLILLLATSTPTLHAQVSPGYAVIDGTQNPPAVVFSNVNVQITDSGTGNYVLTFDDPVVYFSGTSISAGPSFDAGRTMLTAILDSSNPNRVNVSTRVVDTSSSTGHAPTDARFSIEVHF